jgi:hypothetical protein
MRSTHLPPLITASPDGTNRSDVGVLGVPGTVVLFGGPVNSNMTVGGRVTAGYWLDCDRCCGIEGYFFQLGAAADHANAGSPASVGRPFFDAVSGSPNAELVSSPGFVNGTVQASATTGSLVGAGALFRSCLCCGCNYRFESIIGYRYLSLVDNVSINENLTSTDPAQTLAPLGTNVILNDRFHASNQFHGCDFGLTGTYRYNAWTLSATGSIALGATHEHVEINGDTTVTIPGFPPVTSPGGLLALSSNSGSYNRNVFAVVPEVRLQLGYDINACTRIHVGYNFLYWSRVIRAGEQIDLTVNPALLPPPLPGASPLRPAFSFQGNSFWAQGIDLGVEFRF